MLKITSTLTNEQREELKERDPNYPLTNIIVAGADIWLKVRITDPVSFDEFLFPMLASPTPEGTGIEGSANLGFLIQEFTWFGAHPINDMMREKAQRIMEDFVKNELKGRLSE